MGITPNNNPYRPIPFLTLFSLFLSLDWSLQISAALNPIIVYSLNPLCLFDVCFLLLVCTEFSLFISSAESMLVHEFDYALYKSHL